MGKFFWEWLSFFDNENTATVLQVKNTNFGGRRFLMTKDSLGNYFFNCVIKTGLPLDSYAMYIGGMPIALYDTGNQKKAIGIYVFNDVNALGNIEEINVSTIWHGLRFGLDRLDNKNVFPIKDDTAVSNKIVANTVMWYGHKIARDNDNRIFFNQVSGAYQEIGLTMIGGNPILLVKKNDSWHIGTRKR